MNQYFRSQTVIDIEKRITETRQRINARRLHGAPQNPADQLALKFLMAARNRQIGLVSEVVA